MYQFTQNSTVCFFGDSITHKGSWIRRVYEYYLKRDIRFEMYNCGVAGANATNAYGTIDDTLLIHNPTDVVIMFGMNDVWRDLYCTSNVTSDIIMQRRMRSDNCVSSIKSIADKLAAKDIRLIFCTPTPYDELTDGENQCIGVAAALREISERVKEVSIKYGANIVDFNTEMYNSLKALYKNGQTFINPDRVHPGAEGNELMAQIFLKAQGFDVAITPDMDALSALSQKPFSKWEDVRYCIEQDAKLTDFFDWCVGATIKDKEKIKEIARDTLKGEPGQFVAECAEEYLNESRDTKMLMDELIKHTKSVYDI